MSVSTESAPHAQHVVNHNKMGVWGACAFVVGNIIGSGLFISPKSILEKTGSVGLCLVLWAASAVISIIGAFCYVELGTSIRRSGADFAYLCYVGWFPAAFTFMSTGCLMTYPATLAVQAQTFSEYLFKGAKIQLEDENLEYYAKALTSFSLVWLLLFLNFFSVKYFVSKFQILATLSKVASTCTIIGIGMYFLIIKRFEHVIQFNLTDASGKTENLQDPFKGSNWNAGRIAVAFFSSLFSYDGWDILNFGAEEVENPRKTMSLSIVFGLSFVAIIYISTNLSLFVVLSKDKMLSSDAVATTFAQETMGNLQYLMPFFVSILLIGSLNSTLFSASRYLYAGAREGHLPAFIAIVNKKHDSPRCSLFYHTVMAMMFCFAGNTEQLISYLGFAQWIQRSLTMCALLYIRFTHKPVHPDCFRMPIIMPIAFLLVCASLVVVTIIQEIKTAAVGLSFLVGSLFFYVIFMWDKTLLRYEPYRQGARKINEKIAIYNQIIFNGLVDSESTQEGANEEIKMEQKRRATTLASLAGTDKVAPNDSSSIKKQRF
ncbi:Solute carrier family 7 member 13 [Aphelenchoides bicaudatus]|nr:Solute carrier family 7 member 13 [Aphelenchoides bicaudatus]